MSTETIEQRVARIERLLVLSLLDDSPMYVPDDGKERARLTEELKAIVRSQPTPTTEGSET